MKVYLVWKDHKRRMTNTWPADGPWFLCACADVSTAQKVINNYENNQKEPKNFHYFMTENPVLDSITFWLFDWESDQYIGVKEPYAVYHAIRGLINRPLETYSPSMEVPKIVLIQKGDTN